MKTKNILFLSTILFGLTSITSCKKNDTGGKASLHVMVYNGSSAINASTLYVKFDEHHQPTDPTNNYDLKIQGEAYDNHVHVEDLRMGEYYLYAIGYDSITKKTVAGGVATSINWSERKEMKSVDLVLHSH